MISRDLVNRRISITMMSGDRRQGKLIEVNDRDGTFTINWTKGPNQNQDGGKSEFFRTTLRTDRVESITELVRPPKSDTIPTKNEDEGAAA